MTEENKAQLAALLKYCDRLTTFTPLLNNAAVFEQWHRNVLGSVLLRRRINVKHLEAAYTSQLEYLSWSVRNLLELYIWAVYVSSSKENALRFFQNNVIDTDEFVKAFGGMLKAAEDPHAIASFANFGQILKEARIDGNIPERAKHLKVAEIATLVNEELLFSTFNRVLSKLVHPTAFSILLALPQDQAEGLRVFLFTSGLLFARRIFDVLTGHLTQSAVDTSVLTA